MTCLPTHFSHLLTGINITSLGTKVNLHVNDNDCRIRRSQIAIIRPLVGRGVDKFLGHDGLIDGGMDGRLLRQ